MSTSNNEFVTPVGRLVQGSMTLSQKVDMKTNAPVFEDNKPVMESFFAVAFSKTDPNFNNFYAQLLSVAKADFPHLFDANGNCTHPRFAFKIQDGDGKDQNGQSVAGKPGFAGHWIVKFGSRFAPKCFRAGQYDPMMQLQNPDEVIKRGHFIRVSGTVRGNGVKPGDNQNVPGLFISGNLVEWVAFGEEITSGPNAADVFGKAGAAALPPGASMTPVGSSAPAAGAPALPGLPAAAPALPGLPAAAPALPGLPLPVAAPGLPGLPLPGLPAATPVYSMTEKAGHYTREQFIAGGWTEERLLAEGFMVRTN